MNDEKDFDIFGEFCNIFVTLVKTLNLVNEHELSRQLSIGEHGIRILRRQGLIPFIRFGHRTIRYDMAAVANAIKKLSKEIAA